MNHNYDLGHLVDLFRNVATWMNEIKYFIWLVEDERLSEAQLSKISYPVLILYVPEYDIEKAKSCNPKFDERHKLGFAILYNTEFCQSQQQRDDVLIWTQKLTRLIVKFLCENDWGKFVPELTGEKFYENTKMELEFGTVKPYISYEEDNLFGWEVQFTTLFRNICEDGNCWTNNFTVPRCFNSSEFKIGSTDGETITLQDLSSGHDPDKNFWEWQFGADRSDWYTGTNPPSIPIKNCEMWIELTTCDQYGNFKTSRAFIGQCQHKAFCYYSHPNNNNQ